jgi:hypothetical protein
VLGARRWRDAPLAEQLVQAGDVLRTEPAYDLSGENRLRVVQRWPVRSDSAGFALKGCKPAVRPVRKCDVLLRLVVAFIDADGDFSQRSLGLPAVAPHADLVGTRALANDYVIQRALGAGATVRCDRES